MTGKTDPVAAHGVEHGTLGRRERETHHLRAEGRLQPPVSSFGMQGRESLRVAHLMADELRGADEPEG